MTVGFRVLSWPLFQDRCGDSSNEEGDFEEMDG
jgi:hypothetical protein